MPTCSRCGGQGAMDSLDDEEMLRGIQDTCYHCQATGKCQTPGCQDCKGEPMSLNLDRAVTIYLFQNGALDFKTKDEDKSDVEGALPVHSVDSVEEAKSIQVALCRLSRVDNETYLLPFSGKYEDMPKVSEMLEAFYQNLKAGLRGVDLVQPFYDYKEATGAI